MQVFKRLYLITVFLIASLLLAEGASGRETQELSLSDCLNIGLVNNLDVKIAKVEAMIKGQDVLLSESIFDTLLAGKVSYADDQRQTSSSLYGTQTVTNEYELGLGKKLPTGTELAVDYSDTRLSTDRRFMELNPFHESGLSFSFKQPVLKNFFGCIDRGTVRISKIDVDIADIKAKDRIENAIADIEKAYWRLVFEYQSVALNEELLGQAEKLYRVFEKNFKTGLVESTELYETEANMRIRRTDLAITKNDLITASNNLKLLLNEEGNFLIVPQDRLDTLAGKADLIESLKQALTANRSYRMKKKELEAKNVKLKMKKNSLWPEVDVLGTLAMNGVDAKFSKASKRLTTDKFPMYYGGIEVSFPLENSLARSEYKKASLEKEKSILEIIQVEKDISTDVDEKVRAVNLSYENAKRWAKIRDIQYTKFYEEGKKLKYGRSNTKRVVDYQNDFTRAALRSYYAVLWYYYSLIDLENTKDTLLEKTGVIDR